MNSSKYATCMKCAYSITMIEQESLRCAVNCPHCGSRKAFGPGVFIEDFDGYDLDEVIQQKDSKVSLRHLKENPNE